MSQIKAVSIAFNEAGSLYLVDDKGRLWVKQKINNEWVIQDLPEETS